jgi:hypothetical protein
MRRDNDLLRWAKANEMTLFERLLTAAAVLAIGAMIAAGFFGNPL